MEVNTHVLRAGNHVCRSDVCHKGRIGRQGFCRMSYWHWVRFITKAGELGARRAHGLQLQPRWDGVGYPPVENAPPHAGQVMFEINHPFYFKLSPPMMLGPRCNADLGVLLRLPPPHIMGSPASIAPKPTSASGLVLPCTNGRQSHETQEVFLDSLFTFNVRLRS